MNNRNELEDELAELELVHRKLDETISTGYSNYLSDSQLVKMKQEKLILRKSIENIRKQLGL